jgi:hypothetical protein
LLAVGTPGKAEKREETDAESYVAPNDKAVLVLVRNRALLGTVKFRVIDEKRQCRGVLKGRSHVGMVINPGKQKLYVLAAKRIIQAERVDANVTAGRTYIIETRPRAKMKERVEVLSRPDRVYGVGCQEGRQDLGRDHGGRTGVGDERRLVPNCTHACAGGRSDEEGARESLS